LLNGLKFLFYRLFIMEKKYNEFYKERQVTWEEIWTHCFETEQEADEFIKNWTSKKLELIKITWNTYLHRRELSRFGCKFSYSDKVWVWSKTGGVIDFCNNNNLDFEDYEKDIVLDEKFEVEQKNIRARQKAERYNNRAMQLEQKAENTIPTQQERDFLSLGEPIKVWHHSEWRHRKLIDRVRRTYDKQHELYKKSEENERKAKYRENKIYRTEEDKKMKKELAKVRMEQALQLRRDKYKIWDEYIGRHCCWIIEKINNRTVVIKWEVTGQLMKMDIAYSKDFDLFLKQTYEKI